jgi:putative transposase
MHRILEANKQNKERRNQLRHPQYTKPELLATAPKQLWSWDITKLKGPQKWTSYYLYVILDVFSRYVVGWLLADSESGKLAERLVAEACEKENFDTNQLSLHADRGPAMKSKVLGNLLADLGITKTHSRPRVSNDNPFSESQFKTMKYRPEFPKRFGCIQDARTFCRGFFEWYNQRHHHSGLCFLTPAQVHQGQAEELLRARQATLDAAFARHPERFPKGRPLAPRLPGEVWINPPQALSSQQARPENVVIKQSSRSNLETLVATYSN